MDLTCKQPLLYVCRQWSAQPPEKVLTERQAPKKADGEGWLYSEQQQKFCHFKPDTATVYVCLSST